MLMKSSTYDKLKFLAQVLIPALSTCYFAIAEAWGLKAMHPTEVVGTLTALDTFLGTCLHISTNNYWKEDDEE